MYAFVYECYVVFLCSVIEILFSFSFQLCLAFLSGYVCVCVCVCDVSGFNGSRGESSGGKWKVERMVT